MTITTAPRTGGKPINIALWVAQILLAAGYGLFGFMKMTMPIADLADMMLWVPSLPIWFVRGLGAVEALGAIGLILPALTRIQPRLTAVAALCIVMHQLCAVALHVSRGEFNALGLNAGLIALAAFIYWGRSRTSIIAARG